MYAIENITKQEAIEKYALTDQIEKMVVHIDSIMGDYSHIEVKEGPRYFKMIAVYNKGNGCYVYAFIDKTNGDILKPAGWSAPAKHARGNAFDPKTWTCFGRYSVAYLR